MAGGIGKNGTVSKINWRMLTKMRKSIGQEKQELIGYSVGIITRVTFMQLLLKGEAKIE